MVLSASAAPSVAIRQVAKLPFAERIRHPAYWAWVRFTIFGRGVPAMLFGFVGWLQISHLHNAVVWAQSTPSPRALSDVVARALYLLFCCIPVGLYLTRPMPGARDGRLIARAAAFIGTLMQVVIGAFLPVGPRLVRMPTAVDEMSAVLSILPFGPRLLHEPAVVDEIAAPLSIVAFAFAIYAMAYLRRNLSIIPEARKLTTGGPYRLVRHPLYFAEIAAAVALVLSGPFLTPVIALAVFVLMQNLRARFEERLLAANFTDYAAYARRTRRLIPLVW